MTGLAAPLAAAALAGLVAGLLGVPLVLRDLGMFGFGLAHVAFGGVALGLAASFLPLVSGVVFACLGALAMVGLRRAGLRDETALAAVTLSGLAAGLGIASAAGLPRPAIQGVLFGTPLSAEVGDAARIGAVAALGVVGFVLLEKELFYATFDREAAALAGVPVRWLDAGFMGMTAATVVVAAEVAGLLLVGSLLVLPSAAGVAAARTFRGGVVASAAAGVAAGIGGVLAAAALGFDNGAPVVLAGVLVLALGAAAGRRKAARGLR